MVAFPLMTPGCAGKAVTVIANVLTTLLPQALFAVTVMLPLVAPAVVVMEVVVEEPVQPPGNVQV